eukprot:scaffold195391_cov25-Tisochrysis_lutea.AAC.1
MNYEYFTLPAPQKNKRTDPFSIRASHDSYQSIPSRAPAAEESRPTSGERGAPSPRVPAPHITSRCLSSSRSTFTLYSEGRLQAVSDGLNEFSSALELSSFRIWAVLFCSQGPYPT